MIRSAAALALVAATASVLAAQSTPARTAGGKIPLTAEAFDAWKSIDGERLSDDGTWVVYSLIPQVGDGEVVVRSTKGGTEYRHTRGYIGRPQMRPGASRGSAQTFPDAQFFGGGKYVVFTIEPPKAAVDQARRQKKKPADQPKASLGIMRLSDGQVTVIPDVKKFEPPRGAAGFVVYQLQGDTAKASADSGRTGAAAATPGGRPRPIAADSAGGKAKKKDTGTPLVIRNLATGAETRVDDVLEVESDPTGARIAYTVAGKDSVRDGIYLRPVDGGAERAVLTGEGHYKQLAFDKKGTQLAFLSDTKEHGRDEPRYALYHATVAAPAARELLGAGTFDSLIISDHGRVEFSEDGARLQLGVAPAPLDSIPADSLADKAVFDLWHWKDTRLQPQQRIEARRDRDRTWPVVYDFATKKPQLIGGDSMPQVRFSRDLHWAVGLNPLPYAIESMWGEGGNDVFLIDAVTGKRTPVARQVHFGASLSPASRYVMYFGTDGQWYAYSAATGKTANLTKGIDGVRFDQETWDTPSQPAPWGIAGWTPGDRSVVLYDRYDLWEVDPTGAKPARVVTDSVGRLRHMVMRYVELDTAQQFIDPSRPIYLSALNEQTKAAGFWRDRIDAAQKPESLMMAPKRFGRPMMPQNGGALMYTASTFRDFPNLWISDMGLRNARQLSDANPQQSQYKWGTAELVQWRSMDGIPLQGLLYKPDDFDPARKYPMVVYFYEQLSDNLYAYNMSYPRNTIQPTYYTSNGYLAFFPDIAYQEGYPGPSALKSILPGVQMLMDSGFVKEDGVGIAGQSWGGYQTAYIITQTNLFKAAFAGAPVVNMTSAYGGIRWESGVARAFQYEKTQSRIGGSIWERPMRYLENSPLFMADRIETPVLIMSNDADGAVPWYQGIEFFVTMRRLGKEAYLVEYNDEAHNPTKRANQHDIAMRMKQFFDHHLLGKPAPDWMEEGIPFLRKGRGQVAEESVAGEGKTSEAKPDRP